jgi:hypothetical protein
VVFILGLTGEEKERSDFFWGVGRIRNAEQESESPELVRVEITLLFWAIGRGAKVTI